MSILKCIKLEICIFDICKNLLGKFLNILIYLLNFLWRKKNFIGDKNNWNGIGRKDFVIYVMFDCFFFMIYLFYIFNRSDVVYFKRIFFGED